VSLGGEIGCVARAIVKYEDVTPCCVTIEQYCAEQQIDIEKGIDLLKAKGIQASPNQTLREVANENGLTRPSDLIEMLRPQ